MPTGLIYGSYDILALSLLTAGASVNYFGKRPKMEIHLFNLELDFDCFSSLGPQNAHIVENYWYIL